MPFSVFDKCICLKRGRAKNGSARDDVAESECQCSENSIHDRLKCNLGVIENKLHRSDAMFVHLPLIGNGGTVSINASYKFAAFIRSE